MSSLSLFKKSALLSWELFPIRSTKFFNWRHLVTNGQLFLVLFHQTSQLGHCPMDKLSSLYETVSQTIQMAVRSLVHFSKQHCRQKGSFLLWRALSSPRKPTIENPLVDFERSLFASGECRFSSESEVQKQQIGIDWKTFRPTNKTAICFDFEKQNLFWSTRF